MVMDHFYESIRGWAAFAPLYREIGAGLQDGMTLVEIGCWLGRSAALMGVEIANSGKQVKFYCIDPWFDGGADLRHTHHYDEVCNKPLRDQFESNVSPVRKYLCPLQMESLNAVKQFKDKSVDFIMLDGDHNYEAIRDDIAAWLPKMRDGSIMSGDDAMWPGVQRAVAESFGQRAKITMVTEHPDYLHSQSYWTVQL